jgi:hypothetical protein
MREAARAVEPLVGIALSTPCLCAAFRCLIGLLAQSPPPERHAGEMNCANGGSNGFDDLEGGQALDVG